MKTITMLEIKQELNGKAWEQTKSTEKLISVTQFDLITNKDTLAWFRRIGGTESATRTDTCLGSNKVVKLISTSPCRTIRTVRHFIHAPVY